EARSLRADTVVPTGYAGALLWPRGAVCHRPDRCRVLGHRQREPRLLNVQLLFRRNVLQDERSNGTLSLMALAPRSLLYVFAGRIWLVAAHGLVSTAVSLAVGVLAFGMDVSEIAWAPFGLALLTAVFATSS